MRSLPLLLILLCSCVYSFAQTETFDIATFRPPVGWKKSVTDYNVSYSTIDNTTGSWCQLAIYKSVASSDVPANDFSSEWKMLVMPATYTGAVEPSPNTVLRDGWTVTIGASDFTWQNKKQNVLVINYSGYGKMLSVFVSGTLDKYGAEVNNVVGSLQLKQPEQPVQQIQQAQQQPSQQIQQTQETLITPASIIKVTNAAGISGIKTSTTNFNDGWVSQPFADYVKVKKGAVTVLLHYSIAVNDEMRAASNMGAYFWDHMMPSRYR